MKERVKATKKGGLSSIWIKILVFVLILISLYYQLRHVQWEQTTGLELLNVWAFALAFVFIVFNLGCEYYKWKVISRPITSDKKLIKNSFWAGIAAGFMTPNGWGNFLGRLIYFRKRDSLYIVLSTSLSNLSQLIPTLVFGICALLYRYTNEASMLWTTSAVSLLLVLVYFFGDYLLPKKRSRYRFVRYLQLFRGKMQRLKWQLLGLSLLRFQIFSLQYVLLFVAFGYTDFVFLLTGVWMVYLLTSFVPSLWSGKILIREAAALFVFQDSIITVPDILVVSLLIYMLNIALPAFVSSFILLPTRKK